MPKIPSTSPDSLPELRLQNSRLVEYEQFRLPLFVYRADRFLSFTSLLILGTLIAEYGFFLPTYWTDIIDRLNFFFVHLYFALILFRFASAWNPFEFVKQNLLEFTIILAFLVYLVIVVRSIGYLSLLHLTPGDASSVGKGYFAAAQILIIFSFLPQLIRFNQRLSTLRVHPAQVFSLSFLLIITVGTLLLLLPKSVQPGNKLAALDALFTATSATCVTGLVVVDTGTFFTTQGQIIILLLIQIGGIGIISLTSFLALLFGKGVALKERILLQDITSSDKLGIISSMLRTTILIFFVVELLGAALLAMCWHGEGWGIRKLIYNSVFHSVSAFCNAGFALFDDSLMSFARTPVLLTVSTLIILGGLGFPVLRNLADIKVHRRRNLPRLTVQSRIVLIVSALLIVLGALSFILLEPEYLLRNGLGHSLLSAYFTSVTARTAGFNCMDTASLSIPLTLVIMLLMFIGASPGSTGGGIKTTTLAVLWVSIKCIISGKRRVDMYHRNIPFVVLNRALIIFCISTLVIALVTIFLSIVEQAPLLDVMFEAVSAFGTVGLSRGLTSNLSPLGKLCIVITMFIGRIGILTLAFAITAHHDPRARVEYPPEYVMVG